MKASAFDRAYTFIFLIDFCYFLWFTLAFLSTLAFTIQNNKKVLQKWNWPEK